MVAVIEFHSLPSGFHFSVLPTDLSVYHDQSCFLFSGFFLRDGKVDELKKSDFTRTQNP